MNADLIMLKTLRYFLPLLLTGAVMQSRAQSIEIPPSLISFCPSEQSCGFMDITGKVIVAPEFQATRTIMHDRAAYQKNGLWGFMDQNANVVVAPKYDQVLDYTAGGFARVRVDDNYGIITRSGEEVFQPKFTDIGNLNGAFTGFQDGSGKVGVIGKSGEIITSPKYDYLAPTGFGKPVKYRVNGEGPYGKWGYLDADTGKELTPPIYDGADIFHNGLASVKVIPEGAILMTQAKQGMIDENGEVVIPIIYDRVPSLPEYEDIIVVEKDDIFSVVDLKGRHVCNPNPEFYVTQFTEGRAKYRHKSTKDRPLRFGIMNKNCETVTDLIYDNLSDYKNGMAAFERQNKTGYLNYDGEEVVEFTEFDSVGNFQNGLASVKKKRKTGLMDESYNLVVQPKYDFLFGTPAKLTLGKIKDRFYYITDDGKQIGPLKDKYPAPVGQFFTPLKFCGKTFAINSETGEPIGFKWRDFNRCKSMN